MTISAAPPPGGFAGRPGHTIALDPLGKPVAVTVDGIELARSDDAIVMREGDYPAIIYIPAACIRFGRLTRTGSSTHCPFKGDASYTGALPAVMPDRTSCGPTKRRMTKWRRPGATARFMATG